MSHLQNTYHIQGSMEIQSSKKNKAWIRRKWSNDGGVLIYVQMVSQQTLLEQLLVQILC